MPDDIAPSPADIPNPLPRLKPDRSAGEERAVFDIPPTLTTLRNQRFQQQSDQLRREHWFRLVTAAVIFVLVVVWLFVVVGIVLCQGLNRIDLDPKVLIALLVTTTLNVIGLLAAVVRYLFPREPIVFGQDSIPTLGQGRSGRGKHPSRE